MVKDRTNGLYLESVTETNGYLQVGPSTNSIITQNPSSYPFVSAPYVLRSRSLVSATGGEGFADVGLANLGLTQYAEGPSSDSSYETYDGITVFSTDNPSGLTSYATYDIVWTSSTVGYYQNGVLMASHNNSPSASMGAFLASVSSSAFVSCDWIFLHKYASTFPSIAFGQEEQINGGSDVTAPVITIVSPTNGTVLGSSTTSVTITISTDENADCKYSLTNPSFDYNTEGTAFTNGQGTLVHSFTFSGLTSGQTYYLYYKAMDGSGNINAVSTTHKFSVAAADSTWWNGSWLYRVPVTLTENSGSALSGYQVSLLVSFVPSKMKADFSDLRFTDSDKVTPLSFGLRVLMLRASAFVWVKVPSIAAFGTKTIYMYYGNPSAASAR